jgi:hypothetical protein
MTPWVLPAGAAAIVFVSGIAVCLFVLYRSKAMAEATGHHAAAARAELEQRLEAMSAQVEELRQEPAPVALPLPPKPGFNLTKRAQALRMHRRGDSPEQIAAALDVPCQEVELLLKVNRIVLSNI